MKVAKKEVGARRLKNPGNEKIVKNLMVLIKHTMKLSVWEPSWLSKKERLSRRRANERRKMVVREMSENLRQAISERLRSAA